MLLRLSKTSRPYMVALLPVVSLLFWIFPIFTTTPLILPNEEIQMPLYAVLFSLLSIKEGGILPDIVGFILITGQSFLMLNINYKYALLRDRTILPPIIFILLSSAVPSLMYLHPAMFGSLFFIASLPSVFDFYKHQKSVSLAFETSFMVSLGSLFYFPTIYLVLVIWFGLLIMNAFNWREWFIPLIGIFTPYFITISIFFVFDFNFDGLIIPLKYYFNFSLVDFTFAFSIYQYIFGAMCIFLLLLGLTTKYDFKIQTRKYYNVVLSTLYIPIGIFMVYPNVEVSSLSFFIIPVSFIYSKYLFNFPKKILSELIYIIFIGALIIQLVVD